MSSPVATCERPFLQSLPLELGPNSQSWAKTIVMPNFHTSITHLHGLFVKKSSIIVVSQSKISVNLTMMNSIPSDLLTGYTSIIKPQAPSHSSTCSSGPHSAMVGWHQSSCLECAERLLHSHFFLRYGQEPFIAACQGLPSAR